MGDGLVTEVESAISNVLFERENKRIGPALSPDRDFSLNKCETG